MDFMSDALTIGPEERILLQNEISLILSDWIMALISQVNHLQTETKSKH
jgi:hypothetical protein